MLMHASDKQAAAKCWRHPHPSTPATRCRPTRGIPLSLCLQLRCWRPPRSAVRRGAMEQEWRSLCAAPWHTAWQCLPVPPLKHMHACTLAPCSQASISTRTAPARMHVPPPARRSPRRANGCKSLQGGAELLVGVDLMLIKCIPKSVGHASVRGRSPPTLVAHMLLLMAVRLQLCA